MKKMVVALLVLLTLVSSGCTTDSFDKKLDSITGPYQFSIVKWELGALGSRLKNALSNKPALANDNANEVAGYFADSALLNKLNDDVESAGAGGQQAESLPALQLQVSRLEQQHSSMTATVEKQLETQIRESLAQQGIFNPLTGLKIEFPPLNFYLEEPPYLLVVSPRDRIESTREITLVPGMSLDAMEKMESEVDSLGVSSLVVELGGFATYPSYITDRGDLRFTIETAVHEWLHDYLAFKPLGFLYLLDRLGIRRNYDIATINETLVGMVSRELGDSIYHDYYARGDTGSTAPKPAASGFDFNRQMRDIRTAVDAYLAKGEIDQAENFMEQQRQYLETQDYHIRKLNQAYFAFYGTYADSPTSISPIGADLRKLRSRSASPAEFLETASSFTNRQDLAKSVQ